MRSRNLWGVKDQYVWIFCDKNQRDMDCHPGIYFILLTFATENPGICPKRSNVDNDVDDLSDFVATQIIGVRSMEEVMQIANKIEELNSKLDYIRGSLYLWGTWVQDFPNSP